MSRFQLMDEAGELIQIVPDMRFLLRLPAESGLPYTIWVISPGKSGREPCLVIDCPAMWDSVDLDRIFGIFMRTLLTLEGLECDTEDWSDYQEDLDAGLADECLGICIARRPQDDAH